MKTQKYKNKTFINFINNVYKGNENNIGLNINFYEKEIGAYEFDKLSSKYILKKHLYERLIKDINFIKKSSTMSFYQITLI